LALGGGLLLIVLIVLGVKGCLDARARRALSDYSRNVTQIAAETEQTSKSFFGKLSDPGSLSVTEFVDQVEADRSAMDNYAERVEGLDTPGDMNDAQNALELVYQLRSGAMDEIAAQMSTALGDVGSEKASAAIAKEMQTLFGSDVLYAEIVMPEIDEVLEANGIDGSEAPKSVFVPEGTKWLDEATVIAALGSVSGATGASTPGVHGLGLLSTSIGETELVAESTTGVVVEGTPEVEVQVQNLGESTENGIAVSVTVDGGNAVQDTIDNIGVGETASVLIPLTPTPKGEATLEIDVATVPGELVSENNKATYTVSFE
jgi:CARDB